MQLIPSQKTYACCATRTGKKRRQTSSDERHSFPSLLPYRLCVYYSIHSTLIPIVRLKLRVLLITVVIMDTPGRWITNPLLNKKQLSELLHLQGNFTVVLRTVLGGRCDWACEWPVCCIDMMVGMLVPMLVVILVPKLVPMLVIVVEGGAGTLSRPIFFK